MHGNIQCLHFWLFVAKNLIRLRNTGFWRACMVISLHCACDMFVGDFLCWIVTAVKSFLSLSSQPTRQTTIQHHTDNKEGGVCFLSPLGFEVVYFDENLGFALKL